MKYMVHAVIDPQNGKQLEDHPKVIQELIGKWQAHKPIGMYFSLSRRSITIILDAPSEDTFFEALHATWRAINTYPTVDPVADVTEFPDILRRAGIGG